MNQTRIHTDEDKNLLTEFNTMVFGDESTKSHSRDSNVVSSISSVDQMILNLQDASLIRTGQALPLQYEALELHEVLVNVMEDLRAIHGNRFKIKTPDAVHGQWSKSGLVRIFENLLTNAVKYGDSIAPVTLTISTVRQGYVEICVHNTGNPLSELDQKTLFDSFRSVAATRASARRGWGLGLTLVRGVVEAHGGTIDLASDAERGTTFTVKLPLIRQQLC